MSDLFEISLRSKSAEQLINMRQNKDNWTSEQYIKIQSEISKRGLETFDEPELWEEGLLEKIDFLKPKSDFESDLAEIIAVDKKAKEESSLRMASQIISISAVFAVFSSIFILEITSYFSIISFVFAFSSFGIFFWKVYLISLIFGAIALIIVVIELMTYFLQVY